MASRNNWPAIRAGIFAGESGGDYDALFNFSNREGKPFSNVRLRDMTVDQALAFANPKGPYAQWVKGQIGRVATPMGAYQIVGTTLREAKDGLGLKGDERMDEATQERLGQWIMAKQGTDAWEGYRGPRDPASVKSPDQSRPPGVLSGIGSPNEFPEQQSQAANNASGMPQGKGILGLLPPAYSQALQGPDGKPTLLGGILSGVAKGLRNMPNAPTGHLPSAGDARQGADQLLKALTSQPISGILSRGRVRPNARDFWS